MPEVSTFALIHTSGQLQFLAGSPPPMTVGDSAPVNLSLIAASWGGHGLQAWATTVDRGNEAPNQIADTMIAALGGPAHQHWHGPLGICGSSMDVYRTVRMCGLNAAQERLIQQIHSVASSQLRE